MVLKLEKLRWIVNKALIATALIVTSGVALSEPPEYRDERDKDAAGRWTAEQYQRADDFDRQGESQKAEEVRNYGYERGNANRELSDTVNDNWTGNK